MGSWYSKIIFPLISNCDPESVHDLLLRALGASPVGAPLRALFRQRFDVPCPELEVQLWGLTFKNPFGLAAGFDKNAIALPLFSSLGFGHIEVGTVTPEPQSGNPRPRIFRFVRDGALINRMGFPSAGAEAVAASLREWRKTHPRGSSPIIGVNIGKQKTTPVDDAPSDYVRCFRVLSPFADYLTVNVSSPNTPELRKLQEPARLQALFQALHAVNSERIPLVVKIAPDLSLSELDEVLGVCRTSAVSGIIATNTTVGREGLSADTQEVGGLSGRPLFPRSLGVVQAVRERVGDSLPIIAVGGVRSAAEAQQFLSAGATLLQIYTGLVFEGPGLVLALTQALLQLKERPNRTAQARSSTTHFDACPLGADPNEAKIKGF